MKTRSKYLVHDELDNRMPGDLVRIEECRPLSKHKRFSLIEVLQEAERFEHPVTKKLVTKASALWPLWREVAQTLMTVLCLHVGSAISLAKLLVYDEVSTWFRNAIVGGMSHPYQTRIRKSEIRHLFNFYRFYDDDIMQSSET